MTDVGIDAFDDAVHSFLGTLAQGDAGVFFFAGHGAEFKNSNYLLAAEKIPRDTLLPKKAMNAQEILEAMEASGARFNILFLDCCREFRGMTRSARGSTSRGLGPMPLAPDGSIIAFACKPNAIAEDGDQRNGTYTKHLLQHLETPGLRVEDLFIRVRNSVKDDTSGTQVPYYMGSIGEEGVTLM